MILKSDGTVWSTGKNDKGHLGDGTNTNRVNFVKAKDLSGQRGTHAWVGLRTHTQAHTACTHTHTHTHTHTYPRRHKRTHPRTHVPTFLYHDKQLCPPSFLHADVQAIAAGARHGVVLKTDNSVWTTGDNRFGQLGDGKTTNRNTFVEVVQGGQ